MYSAFQESILCRELLFYGKFKRGENPLNSLENVGIQNNNHLVSVH